MYVLSVSIVSSVLDRKKSLDRKQTAKALTLYYSDSDTNFVSFFNPGRKARHRKIPAHKTAKRIPTGYAMSVLSLKPSSA